MPLPSSRADGTIRGDRQKDRGEVLRSGVCPYSDTMYEQDNRCVTLRYRNPKNMYTEKVEYCIIYVSVCKTCLNHSPVKTKGDLCVRI